VKGIGLVLLTFLAVSAAADVRGPDFWTDLDNECYAGGLEQYDDYFLLYLAELRIGSSVDADDPAAGYVIPLTLGPVEAGSDIEVELLEVLGGDPEGRGPYRVHVYFGVSGDEWVDREVAYRVTHRVPGGEYQTDEVTGHLWSAEAPEEVVTGGFHSVVVHTGGFFEEGATEVTAVSKLYLVVGVLADGALDFADTAERLRENPHEGTTVIFPEP